MRSRPLLTVLVVGDTRLYSDGVAHLLRRDDRWSAIGVAYTAENALQRVTAERLDIAVVDISMPQGCDLIRAISRRTPNTQIVAAAYSHPRG